MKEIDEPKAVIRKMVAMFATGDLSELNSFVARDYVDHPGLGEGELRGPQGFSRVVVAARSDLANLHVEIEDLIAEEDKVVARLRWMGQQADGTKVDREPIDIVRVANGQATEYWEQSSGFRAGHSRSAASGFALFFRSKAGPRRFKPRRRAARGA